MFVDLLQTSHSNSLCVNILFSDSLSKLQPLRLLSEVEEVGKPPYSAQVNVAENDGSLDIIADLREELRVAEETIAAQAAQLEHWKAKMAAQAAQLEHWKAKALRQQEANNALVQ